MANPKIENLFSNTGAAVSVTVPTPPSVGQVLTALSATSAQFQTPASTGGVTPLFKSATAVTVVNTAVETTLFGSGTGSLTIGANTLSVGSVLRLKMRGQLSAAGTTPTLTIKIKLGGAILAASSTFTNSPAGSYFDIEADCVVTATGASGSITPFGRVHYVDAVVGDSTTVRLGIGTPSTIDTTSSLAFDCTATWSAASASFSIKSITATLEQL